MPPQHASRASILWAADRCARLQVVVLVVAAVFAMGLVAAEFLESFYRPWNDARLAPAAAWLRGYRLYYGVNEGPLLGLIYPPLAALAYLPAVWAATPEQAVAAGELLTLLYYFAPALAALSIEGRRCRASLPATALCLSAFVLFSGASRALAGPAFWIHADAPALGLACVAVAIVYFRRQSEATAAGMASALAAVLSVLTKQVALPIVAALPLVCLIYDGRRAAGRCVLWLVVAAGASALMVAGWLDVSSLALNALVLPARHPWTGPAPSALASAAGELLRIASAPLALIALCGFSASSARDGRIGSFATWLRERRWTMWIVVGVVMLPTALLGRVKVGGDVNALSYTLYFLAIAAGLTLLIAQPSAPTRADTSRRRAAIWPAIALPLVALGLCVTTWPRLRALPDLLAALPENPERTGYAFALQHRGEVYFPSNPLLTLYGEQEAHHLSDAVYSRALADIEIGRRQIDAFLPRRMRLVAFVGPSDFSSTYLRRFSRRVRIEGLPPHWTVLAREPSTPAD